MQDYAKITVYNCNSKNSLPTSLRIQEVKKLLELSRTCSI